MSYEQLATLILAMGSLGTASYAIVEGIKVFPLLGEMGFWHIEKQLTPVIYKSLAIPFGKEYDRMLRAKYRGGSAERQAMIRTLRQGVRISLNKDNAAKFAGALGLNEADAAESLKAAVISAEALRAQKEPGELDSKDRTSLGRFELAVDARIEAALIVAGDSYGRWMKVFAAAASVLISWVVFKLSKGQLPTDARWWHAVLIGIAAVPVAPIANDLVSAMSSAKKALLARK